jgi:malignant T-cell-amplified sequence
VQVDEEKPVAIFAEGKETALAVGLTRMSTADMRTVNKDIGVINMHHLNDGLWKLTSL